MDKSGYLATNSTLKKLILPLDREIFNPRKRGKEQTVLYKKFALPFFAQVCTRSPS